MRYKENWGHDKYDTVRSKAYSPPPSPPYSYQNVNRYSPSPSPPENSTCNVYNHNIRFFSFNYPYIL
jgi:hypothetical protein